MFGSNKETADQAEATRSNAVVRKENSIIKIYGQPVLPALTRIIFWLMIVLVAAMLLVDINAFARYDIHLGIGHLIKNITATGFFGWMFFSCIILLLSCTGMHQNRKAFWKRKKDTETRQPEESTKSRNERALKRLNVMYIRYIKVSLVGLGIWCIIYIAGIFFI